jgi:group I intron endonuclease
MRKGKLINKSGIYKLQSRLFPDRIYIGSSTNLQRRKESHTHIHSVQNPYIRKHIKEYGGKDLIFSVVEFCEEWQLMEREQYYISELNPYFNIRKFASFQDSASNLAKHTAYKDMAIDDEVYGCNLFFIESQILEFTNEILSQNQIININTLNYGK